MSKESVMSRILASVAVLPMLFLAACGCSPDPAAPPAAPEVKTVFVQIGTGGETGVYYPVGGAIATLVNDTTATSGLRAAHEPTKGSVYNINNVLSGGLQFGLAQSDRQYQAVKGEAEWAGKPQADLRFVCSLHPEVITVVADAAIADINGLKGKRVNIGDPGSGQRQNAIEMLQSLGIDPEKDIAAEGIKAAEAARVLQDGRIDAFFYTVGHPNGAISEVTAGTRKVRLLSITGGDALLARYPFYARVEIPAGTYPDAVDGDKAVSSIGMLTTLISSAAVPDETVYTVTKAIFTGLDRLRAAHPALRGLTAEGMLAGRSAPFHPGAERYLREAGLLK
jgi:uncharacterized protein